MRKSTGKKDGFFHVFRRAQQRALQLQRACQKFKGFKLEDYLIKKDVPARSAEEIAMMVDEYIKSHPWK